MEMKSKGRTKSNQQRIGERNCFHCKHFKTRYTGIGLLYLCDGIVLADEDEEFEPKRNCERFELGKDVRKS